MHQYIKLQCGTTGIQIKIVFKKGKVLETDSVLILTQYQIYRIFTIVTFPNLEQFLSLSLYFLLLTL